MSPLGQLECGPKGVIEGRGGGLCGVGPDETKVDPVRRVSEGKRRMGTDGRCPVSSTVVTMFGMTLV